MRLCVDGATNCYHKLAGSDVDLTADTANGVDSLNLGLNSLSLKSDSLPLPHIISGDFDSVHPCLLKHYGGLGVRIIPTPNQDETDFTKAVKELWKHVVESNIQV